MIRLWIQALRIKDWAKNVFVFLPFLIGPRFGLNEFLIKSLLGVILFGLMSSAVYVFNDIVDVRSDRLHPEKRSRPIASGRISIRLAGLFAFILLILSLVLAAFLDDKYFLTLCAYAANNLLYSFYLKQKTVLDVMSIAVGFVLRAYAGGFVIAIDITKWLLVCIFSLSLFLGFGKRRLEYEGLKGEAASIRKVHESYSIPKLDLLLGTSGAITIVAYMLYTLAPETKALHGTDKIVFTTPFVVYCIYRYMLKVQEQRKGDLVKLIFRDKGFMLAGFLWIVLFVLLIH